MKDAFFWIANGVYCDEASRSAASVAACMPYVDRILITPDENYNNSVFTGKFHAPARQHEEWYLDSTRYFNLAYLKLRDYNRMIFLDTDTYMCHEVDDLFKLLSQFDIIGAHAPGRITSPTVMDIPDAFPELNIGVIGMSRSVNTGDFLRNWYRMYSSNRLVYGNNDQASFRDALWVYNHSIKYYIFPSEYNCRFGFGGFAGYSVKILHGRSKNIQEVVRDINSAKGMRGWAKGKYS